MLQGGEHHKRQRVAAEAVAQPVPPPRSRCLAVLSKAPGTRMSMPASEPPATRPVAYSMPGRCRTRRRGSCHRCAGCAAGLPTSAPPRRRRSAPWSMAAGTPRRPAEGVRPGQLRHKRQAYPTSTGPQGGAAGKLALDHRRHEHRLRAGNFSEPMACISPESTGRAKAASRRSPAPKRAPR